jgi:PAS domain S-box-containing protein
MTSDDKPGDNSPLNERIRLDSVKELDSNSAQSLQFLDSSQDMIESMSRPMLVLDPDLVVLAATRAFYKQFELTSETTLQKKFSELGDGAWQHPSLVDQLTKVLTEDTDIIGFEIRHVRDGGPRIMSVRAHRLEQPRTPRHLILVEIADITERRRTQTSLAHRAEVIGSTYDAIIGVDPNGLITSWNTGAERMYGYAAKEAIGRSVRIVVPKDRRNEMKQILRQLQAGQGVEELETYRIHKDGTPIYVWLTVSPIYDEKDRVVGASTVERDITERKEKEAEIQRVNQMLTVLNARLTETNEEIKAFSYSVSHDLRAPLRAIDGFSEALSEEYSDRLDDSGRDYLKRIRTNVQRMGILIDDMLKLSRLSQSPMSTASIDLTSMVQRLVKTIESQAQGRTVEWKIQDGMAVRGDPDLLEVAMDNLLRNAYKFTAYEQNACIEVGIADRSGRREIYVRDNGIGFDMKRIQTLFTPFRRLHTSEFPGTGIGLALVKRVVDRHNGHIRAEAEEGQGATFFFSLGDI